MLLILIITSAALAQNDSTGIQETEKALTAISLINGLRIRTKPGLPSRIMGVVSEGERLSVVGRSEEKILIEEAEDYWYKIKLNNGKTGWVFGSYLIVEEEIPETEGWVGDYVVNMREYFGLGTKIVERVEWGDRFIVIAKTDKKVTIEDKEDYWYKIKLIGGKTGWVFGGLISIEQEDAE